MIAPAFNMFMKLAAQGMGGGADFMDNPRLDARLHRAGAEAVFDPFKAQAQNVKAKMPMQQAALKARVRAPVAVGGAWDALKRMGTAAGQFLRR